MDTCTKLSAPLGCTGCIFSCFVSYIHLKLPRILHTKTASNIQKKSHHLTTGHNFPILPEPAWNQKLTKRQLVGATAWLQGGMNKQKLTAGSVCDLQNISSWALSPGTSYTIRVRMHLSPGGPKTLFLPYGNCSVKVACASLTGRLNYQQCTTCSGVKPKFKKPPFPV